MLFDKSKLQFDKAKVVATIKEHRAVVALGILGVIWGIWTIFKPAPPTLDGQAPGGTRLYHVVEWGDRAQVPVPNSWCRYGDEHWGELGMDCHLNSAERQAPRCSPRDPADTGEPNQPEGDQSTADSHGYVICTGQPPFAP